MEILPLPLKSGHFSKAGVKRCADDTDAADDYGSKPKLTAKIRSIR